MFCKVNKIVQPKYLIHLNKQVLSNEQKFTLSKQNICQNQPNAKKTHM